MEMFTDQRNSRQRTTTTKNYGKIEVDLLANDVILIK